MLTRDDETIIAQCTPAGSGALALLRLSGSNVRSIVANFSKLASGKAITDVPTHTVHYGHVIDAQGQSLDQVLFIVMDGPRTFTGQDTIEITTHNNPFLIESIIEQAIKHGARVAQEGEFSKRAFLNGKIDLVQAEAINELINANTQMGLKKALAQLEGSFSQWIASCEKQLLRALAFCEASFEFLDEEASFGPVIKQELEQLVIRIQEIKKTFDITQQIRQGIRIALIGSVNAGKSSIFNALLGQQRAIVTDIAGTTRDVIEAGLYKNGNYWTLIDTAGLRQTADIIEQEGIKRSLSETEKADIVLLVVDGSRQATSAEVEMYNTLWQNYNQKIITIKNKQDLSQIVQKELKFPFAITVSGTTGYNIRVLEELIQEKINELFKALESPFLLNRRQFILLVGLEEKLQAIIPMLETTVQYELVSYHLKDALEYISELSGKTVSELGIDAVFKEFCVGK